MSATTGDGLVQGFADVRYGGKRWLSAKHDFRPGHLCEPHKRGEVDSAALLRCAFITHEIEYLAHVRNRRSMRQVAAVRKVHRQHRGRRFEMMSGIDLHDNVVRFLWRPVHADGACWKPSINFGEVDETGTLTRIAGFLGDAPRLEEAVGDQVMLEASAATLCMVEDISPAAALCSSTAAAVEVTYSRTCSIEVLISERLTTT